MFGLEPPRKGRTPFQDGRFLFLANARSALSLLIRHLSPRRVWLPSYLCSALVEAASSRAAFYDVGSDLRSDGSWLGRIRPGDLSVFIDYFGVHFDARSAAGAKAAGAWVVQDCAQGLWRRTSPPGVDFMLYSPRKFIGVPDGGILGWKGRVELQDERLKNAPQAGLTLAGRASRGRRAFDHMGGDRKWFRDYQKSEARQPIGPYAMSAVSRRIICSYPFASRDSRKRRENYSVLATELKQFAVFRSPGLGAPLGFPIRVRNRDNVRAALFENEIYPAVHWPLDGVVPRGFSESHALSREILTLPCDQRYNSKDMRRMAGIVRERCR